MSGLNDLVVVVQLSSGTQLIGKIVDERQSGVTTLSIMDNPMELLVNYDDSGASRLYLAKYMPYSHDNKVVIYSSQIETLAVASELYRNFYEQKVQQFNKAAEGTLDKSEDVYDDAEEKQEEVDESKVIHKHNTTIH